MTTRWLMDEWREAFVAELRLRDVAGPHIGEALAEVDAHCADSGQAPDEAFGDPIRYARTRAASAAPETRQRRWARLLPATLSAFATVAGVHCLVSGVEGLARGTPGALTIGQLVSIGLASLLAVSIVTLLRPGRGRRRWLMSGAVAFGVVAISLPQLIWRHMALQTSAWALLAVGVLLVGAVSWSMITGRALADRVVDPRTGAEPYRLPALAMVAVGFGLPVLLLGLVIVILVSASPR